MKLQVNVAGNSKADVVDGLRAMASVIAASGNYEGVSQMVVGNHGYTGAWLFTEKTTPTRPLHLLESAADAVAPTLPFASQR